MLLSVVAAMTMVANIKDPFAAYIRMPRVSPNPVLKSDGGTWREWQIAGGKTPMGEWRHNLTLHRPSRLEFPTACLLIVTGDKVGPWDEQEAKRLADLAGIRAAVLYQIPNQPYQSKREDALIAYTIERWFATNDWNWPLLFPMTRSVLSAMDALQSIAKKDGKPIDRFVVIGASKRGWTTWLTAASQDKRVVGIVPEVFNNLHAMAQLKHQKDLWGKFAEPIRDYTSPEFLAALESPQGNQIVRALDPYYHLTKIKIPALIVNGSNDLYWATDATRIFWEDIRSPKWLAISPNAGHNLGPASQYEPAIGMFIRHCLQGFRMPVLTEKWIGNGRNQTWRVGVKGVQPLSFRLWSCSGGTSYLLDQHWQVRTTKAPDAQGMADFPLPTSALHQAFFVEAEFSVRGRNFRLALPPIQIHR